MLRICKLRADHVIDFAAEELKKYLRMMMPACGEIDIVYAPDAGEGFRLGLGEDFGLSFPEAEDPFLDDVVHIEADGRGGILAGSNPRSVLFAVYRYLKENGCRWLYPGVDGEYIPIRATGPVRYHHLADHRFRGHCNEGAESQQCMLETIDFYAKLEMNAYMLEFDVPFHYYDLYYRHAYNETNRPPEPVSRDQVLQWKRVCEAEISKRGLQFHDMGHGWTAEPFGLDSSRQWAAATEPVPEAARQHLAMLDGVRDLFGGVALNTNLCMSDPETRRIMAQAVTEYAESHRNVAYIHVWLADGCRNHCECDACRAMRPSDFYMMIMNEIDGEMTARGLDTRVVFIAYIDTLYAPEHIRLAHPERFSLLYAPIQRSYTGSVDPDRIVPPPDYIRNAWPTPVSAEENAAFLLDWQKDWHGPCFSYEYHFWRHLYCDPGMMYIGRRIYEDILSLKSVGLDGYVEDGTQRPFFPNGWAVYIFAEALLHRDCNYDAVLEDYFRHAYGDAWKDVRDILQRISDLFDFGYMEGEKSADPSRGSRYAPDHAEDLRQIVTVAEEERRLAEVHMAMPHRVQTVSMRLLLRHAEYCTAVAGIMAAKAEGRDDEARAAHRTLCDSFGRYEFELERWFDHGLAMGALAWMVE